MPPPVSVVLLAKKSYFPYCLNFPDLINTMVLLTMPLTSHDAAVSAMCQMTEKVKLHLILIILN